MFIVVYVLYAGNSIRYRFGRPELHKTPLWRLFATRGVLIATCVAVATITLLENHAMLAGALTLLFAFVTWIAGRDGIAEDKERMSSFYRALERIDAGTSRQRFGGGPVSRWAGALREADYRSLAASIGDATKRSDASADELLLQMYDGGSGGRIDERGAGAPENH